MDESVGLATSRWRRSCLAGHQEAVKIAGTKPVPWLRRGAIRLALAGPMQAALAPVRQPCALRSEA